MNNLWQYRVRNMFSVTIICLTFLTVGVFLALSNNLHYIAREIAENMAIVFFLQQDLSESDQVALEQEILDSAIIQEARLVTSKEALQRFEQRFPELKGVLDNLGSNPFPSSIEGTLHPQPLSSLAIDDFITTMRTRPGIEDIQLNREWMEKMESLSRLSRAVGFFLGGILILASFFIISNVIRLNVFARKDEVEILRLVGASNSFIRIPFLFEGIVLGILGGLLSLVLISLLTKLFPLYLGQSLGVLNTLINFRSLTLTQSLALVAAGAVIGLLGSLSSLSRFLKT